MPNSQRAHMRTFPLAPQQSLQTEEMFTMSYMYVCLINMQLEVQTT